MTKYKNPVTARAMGKEFNRTQRHSYSVALTLTLQQARVNFANDHAYTHQALVEELTLIERHARDESWRLCGCIAGKHLPIIAGLSSEGYGFSDSDEERRFMQEIMTKARLLKRDIDKGYT